MVYITLAKRDIKIHIFLISLEKRFLWGGYLLEALQRERERERERERIMMMVM